MEYFGHITLSAISKHYKRDWEGIWAVLYH